MAASWHHPAVGKNRKACSYLVEGMGFSEAVGKGKFFPALQTGMVDIGVKSGTTDAVMGKIAEQYDHDIDTRIGRLLRHPGADTRHRACPGSPASFFFLS